MMKKNLKISRSYATALFEALSPDQYELSLKQLENLAAAFNSHQQLSASLLNPAVAMSVKKSILKDLLAITGTDNQILNNFLMLLVENNRHAMLAQISDVFKRIYDNYKKLLNLTVVSARELDSDLKFKISDQLAKDFAAPVEIAWEIDDTLIAGYVVKVGDRVVDASVNGALERFKNVLIK